MTSEQRIAKLERRCQFLSRTLTVFMVVVGLAVLLGAHRLAEPEKLRVTELEVVDAEGKVRITLGNFSSGELDMYGARWTDSAGNTRVSINDFGQMQLQKGEGRVSILAGDEGASLQLSSRGGRPRAMLYSNEDHSGLQLRDTHGKIGFIQETERISVPGPRAVPDPFAPLE